MILLRQLSVQVQRFCLFSFWVLYFLYLVLILLQHRYIKSLDYALGRLHVERKKNWKEYTYHTWKCCSFLLTYFFCKWKPNNNIHQHIIGYSGERKNLRFQYQTHAYKIFAPKARYKVWFCSRFHTSLYWLYI